ncbi:hypothetical protein N1851_029194 [Merluccius polli]|uniref:Uncharacterized protein n=1 Tax=Merluccius polli TaxID=89951 RepID=A0AA47M7C7_MERPO|nr:hypothetical protein N1851_029194 [Merluccius polli]
MLWSLNGEAADGQTNFFSGSSRRRSTTAPWRCRSTAPPGGAARCIRHRKEVDRPLGFLDLNTSLVMWKHVFQTLGLLALVWLLGELGFSWFQQTTITLNTDPQPTQQPSRLSADPQDQSCFCHVNTARCDLYSLLAASVVCSDWLHGGLAFPRRWDL